MCTLTASLLHSDFGKHIYTTSHQGQGADESDITVFLYFKSWIHSLNDFVPVLKKENKWKCSFSPIRGSSFYFSPPPLLVANINQSAGHICKLLQMAYSSTAVYNLQMPV